MRHLIMAGTIALMVMPPNIAAAQEHKVGASSIEPTTATSEPDRKAGESPFGTDALGDVRLRAVAGKQDTTQVSQAQQTATVTRNSVGENSVTGAAEISGNAFQNMSGLSILNVNTGNNVAINASMNVNISISPSP